MADWDPSGDELTLAEELWIQEVAALTPAANQVLTRNASNDAYEWADSSSGVSDHGDLSGLTDDDHTQYLLADGSRGVSGDLTPVSNNGAALGESGNGWADLFLASGAVLNFDSGDVTITHSANSLAISGGDLTVDSDVLVVDSSNDRVGVNSATPDFPFEVYGDGGTTYTGAIITSFSSGDGAATDGNLYSIEIDKNGVEAITWGVNKNSASGGIPASGAFMHTYTSGGTWTFGRNIGDNVANATVDLHINSTGVGIGTSTVSAKLTVSGDVSATGLSSTGAVDFGSADDLEIPNSATPTVDTAGQIAVDTTITDHTGLITYHDGTEALFVIAVPTANLTTTDDHVLAYDADNNEFYFKADSTGSALGSNLSSSTNDILSDSGSIVLGGTGNTNNEALTLDFETVANTVGISSTTGVTTIALSSIGLSGTTITASTGFALGDGDFVGVTSNERFVFNTAGTIVATGADLLVANGAGFVVGHTGQIAVGNATPELEVLGTGAADSAIAAGRFSADASPPTMRFLKSRNATIGSSTIVQDNDVIGSLRFIADDGVDHTTVVANFRVEVDDTSPAENDIGAAFVWLSLPGGGDTTVNEVMRLAADGSLTTTGGGSLTGTWSDLGTVTTIDINGGTIDGTTIGGASAAAGTFTTLGGTTITASVGFALGDGDYVGITGNEVLTFNAAGTIAVSGADLDMGGNNLLDVHEVRLDATPDVDHTANGPTTNTLAAGATIAVGELVYFDGTATEWLLADADAASSAGDVLLAISLEAQTNGNAMLVALPGSFVRDDSWNWTVGAELYVSTTAGGITETAPSGTDDVIRVIGYAVTADIIWFQPAGAYVTHTG